MQLQFDIIMTLLSCIALIYEQQIVGIGRSGHGLSATV